MRCLNLNEIGFVGSSLVCLAQMNVIFVFCLLLNLRFSDIFGKAYDMLIKGNRFRIETQKSPFQSSVYGIPIQMLSFHTTDV